jgi:surfeit locus 1 family protein
VVVIALLALGALFARLGVWQWRRAAEAREVGERFAAAATLAPLTTPPADADREMLRFRELELRGEYVPGRQFLLDNMVHDGVPGYHVLTPWRTDGGWVLVNRGWVPATADRAVLPSVSLDALPVTVRGRIERLPRPGIRLGSTGEGAHTAAPVEVVEFPTAAELADRLGHGVHDYQLLLDPAEPGGYVRDWSAPGLSPDRHVVYAGQWLLFAGGAFAAAVAITIKSRGR